MEGSPDALLGMARAAAPSPFSSFSTTAGCGEPLMLSFSCNGDAGLSLSSGASTMQGLFSRVRGPFTPTQWMELEHQALIYKYFASNAPVPSSLVLPIRRSLKPWSSSASRYCRGGWSHYCSDSKDVEPGRCRRTDGKKWRCSRDAIGDEKYCERHMNNHRNRSRKHVEGQKAKAAIVGPAMVVSTTGHTVASHQQMKCSAANATNPSPRQSNSISLDKHNSTQDHISVSTSMDSFPLSITQSSLNIEKVVLSEDGLHQDYVQTYHEHETGILAEKCNKLQESRLLMCRETIDDGPLGEVFRSKACQPAYADITDEWAAN